MDSILFRRFRGSMDEPCLYEADGKHVLERKHKATIPVILSAPHGGGDRHFPVGPHSMKPRTPGGKNVSMKSDLYTLQMIATIDKYIVDLCGQHCYVVAATVHRRYVDANRNAQEIDENAHNPECCESAAYYQAYHSSLASCIEDCRLRYPDAPHALLLDIHGQATYEDMVVLGTKNRNTCAVLNNSGNDDAIYSVDVPLKGFIWHLHALLGRASMPYPGHEDISPYRGGHIVGRYGTQRYMGGEMDKNAEEEKGEREVCDGVESRSSCSRAGGFDREASTPVAGVQLEFGTSLRSDSVLRGQ
jgi:hypothetical protein